MAKPSSYLFAAAMAATLLFTGCEDEDNEELMGNWVQSTYNFPGNPRGGAVCFVIDNVAYVGTGANTALTMARERYRDFYTCRPNSEGLGLVWSARASEAAAATIAPMPNEAPARNGAVAFSINGKGYVGTGYDGENFLKDFWEYDPKTNAWTRIADFPGVARRNAVAFVIDNVAYVGTGEDFEDVKLGDFYKFDGTTWKTSPGIGYARAEACALVYDGKGYVIGGNNSGAVDWFQCFDPKENAWKELRRLDNRTKQQFDDDYLNLACYGHVGFVLGDKGYITTGGGGYAGQLTWEYDFKNDYWVQRTSFEGKARKLAVSFVLKMKDGQEVPYVTTGTTSDVTVTGSGGQFFTDIWHFNPFECYEEID